MAGARPSFSVVHIVRTLLALVDGPVGRKTLVRRLGVGEGSVRTILKKLSGMGLIESGRLGHRLSKAGEEKVSVLLEKISKPADVVVSELSPSVQKAVVVKGGLSLIESAVGLRDTALKAGADGALILACEAGGLEYAGGVMDGRAPEVSGLCFSDGDVVIVGFAGTREKAEDGAVAIAVEVCGLGV